MMEIKIRIRKNKSNKIKNKAKNNKRNNKNNKLKEFNKNKK
jgi:hypothetical protein